MLSMHKNNSLMNYKINIFLLEKRIQYHLEQGNIPSDLLSELKEEECPLEVPQNIDVENVFNRFAQAYIAIANCYNTDKHNMIEHVFEEIRSQNPEKVWTVEQGCLLFASLIQTTLSIGSALSLVHFYPEIESFVPPFPMGTAGQA